MSEESGPPQPGEQQPSPPAGPPPAAPPPGPPPPTGPVFNPQTGYPVGQEPPAPPAYPTYPTSGPPNPYGAPNPYAGAQPPPPPAVPGMQQFPVYVLPDHPRGTAALVVGIVALAGALFCAGLPLLASPVAWVLGAQARRQIRQAPQQWGGEGKATTGMILGIIGTVFLVLVIVAIAILVIVAISDPSAFDDSSTV